MAYTYSTQDGFIDPLMIPLFYKSHKLHGLNQCVANIWLLLFRNNLRGGYNCYQTLTFRRPEKYLPQRPSAPKDPLTKFELPMFESYIYDKLPKFEMPNYMIQTLAVQTLAAKLRQSAYSYSANV